MKEVAENEISHSNIKDLAIFIQKSAKKMADIFPLVEHVKDWKKEPF